MSGLTPTKTMDEILGLEDAPDAFTFLTLPPEEREKFNAQARGEKFKEWDRDDARRRVPRATTTRSRRSSRPTSSSRTRS